jgi:hypothetical protein
MTAIVGQDYALKFTFFKDGEFISPDEGSVTFTLYANDGSVIDDFDEIEVEIEEGEQEAVVLIEGAAHTLASGAKFEQRSCVLTYYVNDFPYQLEQYYYVTNRLNVRASPEAVIARLGLKVGEVDPADVDILAAYIFLDRQLGGTLLDDALASAGHTQISANRAVLLAAALDLTTALELKALQKAGGETMSFSRAEKLDFNGIRAGLQAELQNQMGIVQGAAGTSVYAVGTTSVDAVTGV